MRTHRLALFAVAAALCPLGLGCGSKTSSKPPIQLQRNMYDTQRGDPQEESQFFPDGRVMRHPVPGTVARNRSASGSVRPDPDMLAADPHFYEGIENGEPAVHFPVEITRALLERGRQQYDIFCSACHDRAGTGKGLVPKRGLAPPPSFHDERIRKQRNGYIFQTISNGRATMPPYRHSIPPRDRWAIVAYLRVLQTSSAVSISELSAEERKQIHDVERPQ